MSSRSFRSMFLQTFHNTLRTIICIPTGLNFWKKRRHTREAKKKRKKNRCLHNDQFVAWLLTILILLPAIAPLQFPDSTNIDQFCLREVCETVTTKLELASHFTQGNKTRTVNLLF